MGMDRSVIDTLLARQSFAVLISDIQNQSGDSTAKRVAHWFASAVSDTDQETAYIASNFVPEAFIELSDMVEKNELSSTAAKEVFNELLYSDKKPRQIAEEKNLLQVSDEGFITAIVDEILSDPANEKAIYDIRNGNDKVIGFLVGQIMKKSHGKANPALVQKLIRERLSL